MPRPREWDQLGFPIKILYALVFSRAYYMTRPSHPPAYFFSFLLGIFPLFGKILWKQVLEASKSFTCGRQRG
jgi:hypothetical protein